MNENKNKDLNLRENQVATISETVISKILEEKEQELLAQEQEKAEAMLAEERKKEKARLQKTKEKDKEKARLAREKEKAKEKERLAKQKAKEREKARLEREKQKAKEKERLLKDQETAKKQGITIEELYQKRENARLKRLEREAQKAVADLISEEDAKKFFEGKNSPQFKSADNAALNEEPKSKGKEVIDNLQRLREQILSQKKLERELMEKEALNTQQRDMHLIDKLSELEQLIKVEEFDDVNSDFMNLENQNKQLVADMKKLQNRVDKLLKIDYDGVPVINESSLNLAPIVKSAIGKQKNYEAEIEKLKIENKERIKTNKDNENLIKSLQKDYDAQIKTYDNQIKELNKLIDTEKANFELFKSQNELNILNQKIEFEKQHNEEKNQIRNLINEEYQVKFDELKTSYETKISILKTELINKENGYNESINKLNSELELLSQDKLQNSDVIKSIKDSEKQYTDTINKLEKEIEALENMKQQKDELISKLEDNKKQNADKISNLEKQITAFENAKLESEDLTSRLLVSKTEYLATIKDLEAQVEVLEKEKLQSEELANEVLDSKEEYLVTIKDLETQVKTLESVKLENEELASKSLENETMYTEKINSLENQIEVLENQKLENEELTSKTLENETLYTEKISTLENQVESLEKEKLENLDIISKLEDSQNTNTQTITSLETNLEELNQVKLQYEELLLQQSQTEETISQLNSDVEVLNGIKLKYEDLLVQSTNDNEKILQLNEKVSELTKVVNEKNDLISNYQNIETELNDSKELLVIKEQELAIIEKKLEDNAVSHTQISEALAMQKELSGLEAQNQLLEKQLISANNDMSTLKDEIIRGEQFINLEKQQNKQLLNEIENKNQEIRLLKQLPNENSLTRLESQIQNISRLIVDLDGRTQEKPYQAPVCQHLYPPYYNREQFNMVKYDYEKELELRDQLIATLRNTKGEAEVVQPENEYQMKLNSLEGQVQGLSELIKSLNSQNETQETKSEILKNITEDLENYKRELRLDLEKQIAPKISDNEEIITQDPVEEKLDEVDLVHEQESFDDEVQDQNVEIDHDEEQDELFEETSMINVIDEYEEDDEVIVEEYNETTIQSPSYIDNNYEQMFINKLEYISRLRDSLEVKKQTEISQHNLEMGRLHDKEREIQNHINELNLQLQQIEREYKNAQNFSAERTAIYENDRTKVHLSIQSRNDSLRKIKEEEQRKLELRFKNTIENLDLQLESLNKEEENLKSAYSFKQQKTMNRINRENEILEKLAAEKAGVKIEVKPIDDSERVIESQEDKRKHLIVESTLDSIEEESLPVEMDAEPEEEIVEDEVLESEPTVDIRMSKVNELKQLMIKYLNAEKKMRALPDIINYKKFKHDNYEYETLHINQQATLKELYNQLASNPNDHDLRNKYRDLKIRNENVLAKVDYCQKQLKVIEAKKVVKDYAKLIAQLNVMKDILLSYQQPNKE